MSKIAIYTAFSSSAPVLGAGMSAGAARAFAAADRLPLAERCGP
jgi:hypothetical protein